MAKEYNERSYRAEHFSEGRISFTAGYRKSDLWIAVDRASYDERMPAECVSILRALWSEMEAYLAADPGYEPALTPYPVAAEAPEILREMADASAQAGIGPMSAVAGAVSRHVAVRLKEKFPYREIIIENGGDIYAEFSGELLVAILAGESPLSGSVALRIPGEYSPLGICTSSGTVGPSLSFGKADAVMIACRDVALADTLATAFANRIQTAADIDTVIEDIGAQQNVLSGVIVKDDKIGIVGEFELEIISRNN